MVKSRSTYNVIPKKEKRTSWAHGQTKANMNTPQDVGLGGQNKTPKDQLEKKKSPWKHNKRKEKEKT